MEVFAADPYILYDKNSGYYYCYATSDLNNNHFSIHRSKNLKDWEFIDYALKINSNHWGKDWYWAPEVYFNKNNNKYYMFYSAKVNDKLVKQYFDTNDYEECCKIGVATSDSPCGPFIDIENRPIDYFPYDSDKIDINLISNNKNDGNVSLNDIKKAKKGYYLSLIDANLFFDDDGKIYLYYSRCCYRNWVYDDSLKKFIEESNILCVELDNKWWFDKEGKMMPTISSKYIGYDEENHKRKDKFVEIISYHKDPQNWENGHVNDYKLYNGTKKDRRWSEGSTLFYRYINDKKIYFITYSCNNYENEYYGVGIATSTSPLGPFKKQEDNPIIHEIPNCNLYSTGHGSWFKYNGEDYYSFHGRDSLHANRALYIGKMHFDNTKCELINFYRANLIRNK